MPLLILKPSTGEEAYDRAAHIFAELYRKVTGKSAVLSETDDGRSDLVVIGSDSVNDFTAEEMLSGDLSSLGIRYGTDDYRLYSYQKGERKILLAAGGRGRSSIYAVYDYFERFVGCHYFWDGDVIPKCADIPLENIDVTEKPRFEYRGLRYFAHRGLHRFQAEHWSYADWQKEIDWMLKKRLNFFMLRIGMDDVWQKAFPDIVPYPDGFRNIDDEKGFNDRTDFWTLEYRGKLRKKIMEYARLHDLVSPTDCGTMTHWYSRTPTEFLKAKKPALLGQTDGRYIDFATGCVFDFRKKENMEYYMRLTRVMAEEYDHNSYLFHTIGLGERRMFRDDKTNFRFKQLCYRRIAQNLRAAYPDSRLLVGTWDFVGWWRPEEVRALINEFDPDRTVILDYTSEGNDEEQNFTNWGIVGKFPWIFGLFHAYESESELRGPYDLTCRRLKIAAEDDFCKGMILWPELSHSDPIVLEYLSDNAWSPLRFSLEETVEKYCRGRYESDADDMNDCWQRFLPFMKQASWGGYAKIESDGFETDSLWNTHSDMWVKPASALNNIGDKRYSDFFEKAVSNAAPRLPELSDIIEKLADINERTDSVFLRRDSIDIIRTVCGRFMNYLLAEALFKPCGQEKIDLIQVRYNELLSRLSELLRFNPDFSLYASLKELEKTAPVNPRFADTLKNNIGNDYCRQCCSELIDFLFIGEAAAVFEWAKTRGDKSVPKKKAKELEKAFSATPLEKMQRPPIGTLPDAMRGIAREVRSLDEVFRI